MSDHPKKEHNNQYEEHRFFDKNVLLIHMRKKELQYVDDVF